MAVLVWLITYSSVWYFYRERNIWGVLLPSGVTILVEDNGPGIAKGREESIFQRGYRDEITHSVSGSGIGLHIARDLVQRMGGTLEVAADKPKGALNGARLMFRLYRRPQQ